MRLTEAEAELLGKLLRNFQWEDSYGSVHIRDSAGARILFEQIHDIPATWGEVDDSPIHFSVDKSTQYFMERTECS